ncbi:peptidylprolyl isomerase [Terricaulis sp.]|uniref:peptidylprolyl isomerase n=1 Tax=Terricaulis sp. TaxID=2768686 RepID=UPI002AC5A357|nr:peptidylprolyl isomerase [Terricaulis sp.]MDZ4693309.1 peptidylprolyl isomerase [Terricaulis sp.]
MLRLGGIYAAALMALSLSVASAQTPDPRNWRPVDPENTLYIDTVHGRIVIELYPEIAPRHVERIKTLTRGGFYNGLTFHRVIDDFMAQTGDPLGTGEGASSLPDLREEFMFRRGPEMPFIQAAEQSRARLGFYKALPIESQPDAQMAVTVDGRVSANALHCQGVVSMARAEPVNSANSQFFIMRQPNSALDKRYTIFGRVVWGMEAVMGIAVGNPPPNPDRMLSVRVASDAPESERAPIYVLRTDGPQFRDLIEDTRRERRADFSVCDVQIPARVPNSENRERSWWSIIPFIP